ncbi:hypothetical protein [Pectobacterium brasiliense]|uniref:hypothetical protein n=1 Tax=Pectobacterium brasiliense TaxID=180957 RepID=UPI0015DEA501|nr:hypothetical protein [Pectobacterium brasiliense]MBA0215332.1 hypothetical protein [Pectobacterium brasiliense]
MRFFRWIIIALITPISVFSLGIIYNSFRLNQFEWGSVSDWVSSTANAFMAAAALYAAWKAKDWIRLKNDESAYNYAREALVFGYMNVNRYIQSEHNKAVMSVVYLDLYINILGNNAYLKPYTDNEVNVIIYSLKEFNNEITLIDDKLKTIKKFGYSLDKDIQSAHDEYIQYSRQHIQFIVSFWEKYKRSDRSLNSNTSKTDLVKLINEKVNIEKLLCRYDSLYKKVDEHSNYFWDYIKKI